MKRILCMLSLLLVAAGAGAQAPGEGGALAPGIKYRVGVGSRVTQNYSVLTESLDFGVGYRLDGQNVFGVVGQICQDAVQVTQGARRTLDTTFNLLVSYTHDFSPSFRSFYMGCNVGTVDVFGSRPGVHAGIEPGYRFLIGGRVPTRLGLLMDYERRGTVPWGPSAENDMPAAVSKGVSIVGLMIRVEL